ncbi:MAG: hypothetical protein M1838_001164 [Thelocarpon superellum]|nr:MAG: hypothetical protein M1838_001164 [Thelocarpon superellum]
MDYSYLNIAAPQSYDFLALPPTPDATNRNTSEESYSNGSPNQFNMSKGQVLDPLGAHFNANPNGITPPLHSPDSIPQNANGIPRNSGEGEGQLDDQEPQNRSSSEDKEALTPAKSRRKAQNRAAQRAFRERKDRYLKEVETKLNTLEAKSTGLLSDNERLKHEVEKLATENEILRATAVPAAAAAAAASQAAGSNGTPASAAPVTTGPQKYSPTDFYSGVLHSHGGVDAASPSHHISVSPTTGERLLGAGATWDYIVGHDLFRRGLIDIADITDRLKNKAKCDGHGPSFEETEIRKALHASAASGSDELI